MTIIERLGGRKASITFTGQFVLLAGYIFCVKAGGDSATFLTFAGAVCGLVGVGFGANAYVHKVQQDNKEISTPQPPSPPATPSPTP